MSNVIFWTAVGGTGFIGLLIIGMIFRRLYTRASAERSFVRTGLGGQKVIMSGGAIVLPVFHETILINMNTLKLEVNRAQQESLITRDRMRVDVIVGVLRARQADTRRRGHRGANPGPAHARRRARSPSSPRTSSSTPCARPRRR